MVDETAEELSPEQQMFAAEAGAIPDVVASSPASPGETIAPGAAVQPAMPGAALGWPPEFFGVVFSVLFVAVGEKYRLNEDEKKLLGDCGKRWWDSWCPVESQTPGTALLGALAMVVVTKVGGDQLLKMFSGKLLPAASTKTALSAAEPSSSASQEAESLMSSLESSQAVPAF